MPRVLVVDDVPRNVKLLADILTVKGYDVQTADCGAAALEAIRRDPPDLVLLDVMMPDMSGYDVCRTVRDDPAHRLLPIVMVTALDPAERINGLEAGADDFLTKPINTAELLARVRSLVRIKSLHDEVQRQREELAEWNRTLERRVAEGVAELERLSRLKRFFSPQIADLILAGDARDPLRSHRSEIVVVMLDLRGYTEFTDTADPEEVMGAVHEYHAAMGRLIVRYEGTLERFAGDAIMIFFNDPLPLADPADHAVRMALEMQQAFRSLAEGWQRKGYSLDMGIGVAQGYATLGAIGFEGRFDYGAIGAVCSLAARLCAHAKAGQTLVSQRVYAAIEHFVVADFVGELALKGFNRPLRAFDVRSLREPERERQ
jgi:class 3 adenylate cyclase